MKTPFVLVLLAIFPSCVSSQITLVESGPGILKPSGILSLSCRVSGFSLTSYGVHWVRQPAGKGLEWLGVIWGGGSTYYSPALTNRLSISRDTSKSEVSLEITGMRPEDTARYYCARDWGAGAFDYWGQGMLVTVTSDTLTRPSVFPLVSCCRAEKTQVTIGCLVTGYFPEPVEVTWNSGSAITTGIKTFPAVLQKSPTRYTLSSQLSIRASDWESKTYQCKVKHKPSNTDLAKDLSKKACAHLQPMPPTVQLLLPPCEEGLSTSELTCLVTNFKPQMATVEWLVSGTEKVSPAPSFHLAQEKDSTFVGRSKVNVNKQRWENGDTYTCRVSHPPTTTMKLLNISRCSACLQNLPAPVVYLVRPSYEDCLQGKGSVSCLVLGHDLGHSKISWNTDGKPSSMAKVESQSPFTHSNKTQSIRSTHPVTLKEWKELKSFSCTVRHPCFGETQAVLTIRDTTASPVKSPLVSISQPSLADLSKRDSLTLLCEVSGFFPQDVSVSWENNGTVLPKSNYVNGPVMKTGQTFSTHSLLSISKQGNGGSFTCVVQHETFERAAKQTVSDVFASLSHHKPSITVLQGSGQTLVCLVTDFAPKEIKVSWTGGENNLPCTRNAMESLSNGRFRTSCHLDLIEQEEWSRREDYSCSVQHAATNTDLTEKLELTGCLRNLPAPAAYLVRPSYRDLHQEKTFLRCLVVGFDSANATISWEVDGKSSDAMQEGSRAETNPNKTQSIWSSLLVTREQWKTSKVFTCRVKHPCFGDAISNLITRADNIMEKPPLVSLSQPSLADLSTKDSITLLCEVSDFFPQEIMVTWENNGTELDESRYTEGPIMKIGETFTTYSFLIIKKQTDMGDFTCVVQHETLVAAAKQTLSDVFASLSHHKPSVTVLQGSGQTLVCLVTDFAPKEIKVSWTGGKNNLPCTRNAMESLSNGRFRTSCHLDLTEREEWSRREDYSCSVQHTATNTDLTEKLELTGCLRNLPAPAVYLVRPSYRDLHQEKSFLRCLVVGFDSANATIRWEVDGKSSDAMHEDSRAEMNPNKTRSIWSSLLVTREQWKTSKMFTCRVKHPCFGDTISNITTRDDNIMEKPPSVFLSQPSLADLSMRDSITLLCEVSDFFPQEIRVTWENNGTELDESRYTEGPIIKIGQSFTTYSLLIIKKQTDGGDFTCVVQHETLAAAAKQTLSDVFGCSLKERKERKERPKVMLLVNAQHMCTSPAEGNNVLKQRFVCLATKLPTKQDIKVKWHLDGRLKEESIVNIEVEQKGTYRLEATKEFYKGDWKETLDCTVVVLTMGEFNDTARKCPVKQNQRTRREFPGIRNVASESIGNTKLADADLQPVAMTTYILKPCFQEIFLNDTATVTCVIQGSSHLNVTMAWTVDGDPRSRGVATTSILHLNGTTSVISSLRSTAAEWRQRKIFTCHVAHPGFLHPQQMTVQREQDSRDSRKPQVSLLPPSPEEVAGTDPLLTLLCLAHSFYPQDLLVWWKENPTLTEAVTDTPLATACDHATRRCDAMARLTIHRSRWEAGTAYTCLVAHSSSERPIARTVSVHEMVVARGLAGQTL